MVRSRESTRISQELSMGSFNDHWNGAAAEVWNLCMWLIVQ